jgi:hypothetical protein
VRRCVLTDFRYRYGLTAEPDQTIPGDWNNHG